MMIIPYIVIASLLDIIRMNIYMRGQKLFFLKKNMKKFLLVHKQEKFGRVAQTQNAINVGIPPKPLIQWNVCLRD